jgi:hypothetical protein
MEHKFLVAAFCVTWGVQLGYVLWMAVKWQRLKSRSGHKIER